MAQPQRPLGPIRLRLDGKHQLRSLGPLGKLGPLTLGAGAQMVHSSGDDQIDGWR